MEWTFADLEKEIKLTLKLQGFNTRNYRSFEDGMYELEANIGIVKMFDVRRESTNTIWCQIYLLNENTEHRIVITFGDYGNIESVEAF